ncbi:hypothetical protein AtNW77_Chr5g0103161 [Arabidopsis thaliana]|uniref:Uncharacterized protein n=2 Tax=Arabidopsis thaliana TaxID=3702 RepID=A0A654G2R9_ARATH|nr:uncharacterized protein AT5G18933 [Arabidopsis thaliana]ANM70650.1 hypothetical protein AT5G18933 [Arabidopsis thaliana]CAA0403539.1 unnamed protein product [Arabidopsis thaliana]VYS67283.1 unnamed protein product [Arabidopsis thaliana]|eukprot:NP_001332241.1 hypothetical protein AT5G18933 [Arabidopsis thaliana]
MRVKRPRIMIVGIMNEKDDESDMLVRFDNIAEMQNHEQQKIGVYAIQKFQGEGLSYKNYRRIDTRSGKACLGYAIN